MYTSESWCLFYDNKAGNIWLICYLCNFIWIFAITRMCHICAHIWPPLTLSVRVRPTCRGVGVIPLAALRVGTKTEWQLQQEAAAAGMRRGLHHFQTAYNPHHLLLSDWCFGLYCRRKSGSDKMIKMYRWSNITMWIFFSFPLHEIQ